MTACQTINAARSKVFSVLPVRSPLSSLYILFRRSACWKSVPSVGDDSRLPKHVVKVAISSQHAGTPFSSQFTYLCL